MKVKSVEQSAAKWLQRTMLSDKDWMAECFRAFLDGKQNLRWIIGIVSAFGDMPAANGMFTALREYRDTDRYRELESWFGSGCPITAIR